MKTKTLILARPGIFNHQLLTTEHLKQMVNNFMGSDGIPLCFGHFPRPDMPKLGYVKDVWIQDNLLYGNVMLHQELEKAFNEGFFDAWSIAAHVNSKGEYYLHHLAILGEEPPAIKNLKKLTREKLGFVASDMGNDLMYFTEKQNLNKKEESNMPQNRIEQEVEELSQRIQVLEEELRERDEQIQKMGQAVLNGDMAALEIAMQGKIPKETQETVLQLADALVQGQQSVYLSDHMQPLKLLKKVFDSMPKMITGGRLNLPENSSSVSGKLQGGAI